MRACVNLVWAVGPELGLLERLSLATWLAAGSDVRLWTYEEEMVRAAPDRVKRMQLSALAPRETMFRYSSDQGFRPHSGKGSLSHWNDMIEMQILYLYGGWFSQLDVTVLALPDPAPRTWFPPLNGWPGANYQTCVATAPAFSPWLLTAREAMRSGFRPEADHWFRCLELLDPVLGAEAVPAGGQGVGFEDNVAARYMDAGERPGPGVHFLHWSRAGLDGRQGHPKQGTFYAELLERHGL